MPRRNSAEISRKDDKMSTITIGKEEKSLEKGEENNLTSNDTNLDKKSDRKFSEIQVIPLLSPETPQANQARKLLPQRSRSTKRLLSNKQPPKSAGKKRVPLDAISCISDYSVLSNIEFAPRKSSAGKRGQQEGTSLLTSKSLKDFTNSPEGKVCCLYRVQMLLALKMSSRGDGVTSAFSKLRPIWISHLYYFFPKMGKLK